MEEMLRISPRLQRKMLVGLVVLLSAVAAWRGLVSMSARTAAIGVAGQATEQGLRVLRVARLGPAERAGVRPADVLLTLDGKPVTSPEALAALLQQYRPGQELLLTLRRDGQEHQLCVCLADAEEMRRPRARAVSPVTPEDLAALASLQRTVAFLLAQEPPKLREVQGVVQAMEQRMTARDEGEPMVVMFADEAGMWELEAWRGTLWVHCEGTSYQVGVQPLPPLLRRRFEQFSRTVP